MQSKDDHDIEAAPYLDDESIVVVLELVWVLSVQHRLSSHLFSSVEAKWSSQPQTEMLRCCISGYLNIKISKYRHQNNTTQ